MRARLGKTTNLALNVFSLCTLVWRPSRERFFLRWSTAIPIVGAYFLGIPAACLSNNNRGLNLLSQNTKRERTPAQDYKQKLNPSYWKNCIHGLVALLIYTSSNDVKDTSNLSTSKQTQKVARKFSCYVKAPSHYLPRQFLLVTIAIPFYQVGLIESRRKTRTGHLSTFERTNMYP